MSSVLYYFTTNRTLSDGEPVYRRWSKGVKEHAFVIHSDAPSGYSRVCDYCDDPHHGWGLCYDHYKQLKAVKKGCRVEKELTLLDPDESKHTTVVVVDDDNILRVFRDHSEWLDWRRDNAPTVTVDLYPENVAKVIASHFEVAEIKDLVRRLGRSVKALSA